VVPMGMWLLPLAFSLELVRRLALYI
jgi:hypothetical protein